MAARRIAERSLALVAVAERMPRFRAGIAFAPRNEYSRKLNGTHVYLTVLTGTHMPCSPNGPRRSPTRRFDFHWQRTNAAALAHPRPFPSNSGPISHLGANSHLARRPRFDAMRGAPLSAALRAWLRAYLEAKGCKSIKFAVLLDKVSVTGIHGSAVLGNRYSW